MKINTIFLAGLFVLSTVFTDAPMKQAHAQSVGGCTNYSPTTGETVECRTDLTSSTSGVQAPQNTTVNDVTVNIQSGVRMDINGSTIGLGSGTIVSNAGILDTNAFYNGYGISSGANGRSQAGNNRITNESTGSILTNGTNSTGIYIISRATALSNTINNYGTIQTGGGNAHGIYSNSSINTSARGDTITNTGTITTSGSGSYGIYSDSTAATQTISNSGFITSSGSGSSAVRILNTGNIVSLTNSGEIVAKGAADAIYTQGAFTLTNSGKICVGQVASGTCTSLAGANGNGIQLVADSTNTNRSTITNQSGGFIVTTASGYSAISSSLTTGVDIYNYGSITSPSSAVSLSSGSNTLTLYGGSSISGGIAMNTAATSETLTFSGFTNSNFSNSITGVNILKSLSGSSVTMTGSSPIDIGAGTIEVDSTSSLQINSVIADRTAPSALVTSINKTGSGTLNLTGANTYTGGTTLTAGTIGVGNNTALGTGSLTMSDATTLKALSGVALANLVTLNGASTFDTNGQSLGMTGVISGVGSLTKTGLGSLSLNAANTYTGNTLIQSGAIILNGSITSNTTVASGAMLQGGGTIFGSLTNNGNIAPSISGTPTNLTVSGSYSSQGGTLTSAFYPGAQQAVADTLTITGAGSIATGQTEVIFNNINNLGQATVGDGILIVNTKNGAKTATNAFNYPGRLAQGSYEYRLVRGGTSSADNWYVRADNSAAVEFVNASAQPSIEAVIEAGGSITPQATERYEVANYPALKSLGRMYTMSIVDNLDLRRGDLLQLNRTVSNSSGTAWGRMIATGNQLRSSDRSDGPGLDGKAYAAQLGVDLFRRSTPEGGLTVAGPFVTFGQTSGNTFTSNGEARTGNTLMQGYSFGFNATHMAANGIYVDGLVQGTRFVGARANSIMDTSINTTGWGLAASVESGWRLPVSQRFSVTPQAQVWLVSNKFSDTGDALSRISLPTDTSTIGRIGVKLSYDTSDGKGPDTTVWLRLSGLSTMSGRNMQTVFQNTQGQFGEGYNGQSPTSWMTVDAGLNVKTGKHSQLYLNIGYDTSLSNAYQGIYGRAGMQFAF